jgi:hypothetical protein
MSLVQEPSQTRTCQTDWRVYGHGVKSGIVSMCKGVPTINCSFKGHCDHLPPTVDSAWLNLDNNSMRYRLKDDDSVYEITPTIPGGVTYRGPTNPVHFIIMKQDVSFAPEGGWTGKKLVVPDKDQPGQARPCSSVGGTALYETLKADEQEEQAL